jgi:iron complex outermembrane recepter protein
LTRSNRLRVAVLTGLVALYGGTAAAEQREFDIPSHEAAAALAKFGQQAGQQLLFDYDRVRGRTTNPVKGLYEPAEALTLMLSGSGLSTSIAGDGVLVIEESGAAANESTAQASQSAARARGGGQPAAPVAGGRIRLAQAQAQSTPASGPRSQTAEQDRFQLETIVVTGSRIPVSATATPMPVIMMDREAIEASGKDNIADVVLDLPSVGVGVGVQNTRQSTSFGAGRNLVNLRRLGANRTLVLVNGRRQVSGAPLSASVDLNTIPAPLVERTEVVTGGTSAVYGADAVSGVINIILREDFEGLEMRARSGISSRGDAESQGLSLTAGTNFGDDDHDGNITLSVFYDNVEGVEATDRGYAVTGLDTISNPANTAINDGVPNFIHSPNIRFNGLSDAGDFTLRGQRWIFNSDGQSMRLFDFGAIGNRAGRSIGGDGGFFERFDPLSLPIQRGVFAGTMRYGVAANVDLFFEGRYANTKVKSAWQPTFDPAGFGVIELTIDNPFLPADTVALMRGNPSDPADDVGSVFLNRVLNELGRRGTENDRDMYQFVGGFKGSLPNDWTFEISYARGRTTDTTQQFNDRHNGRFFQSIDAIRDPVTGAIVCRDPSNGCVPLNLVGPNRASAEALAFSRINSLFYQSADQQVAAGNVGGRLFDLPAGPLQFSLGAEYRKEEALSQPSGIQQLGESFAPLVLRTEGSFNVKEAFAEVRVPLLADVPLVDELSINGAVRGSDYSTSGNETAWNTGLEFQPVQDFKLRGVLSRSVRAPNLGELFSPANEGFFFGQDPCDASVNNISATRLANCAALGIPANYQAPTNGRTLKGLFGGNPELIPETGDTWSAGFVLRPRFLDNFYMTADYWHTEITDAVNAIPPQAILNNCVDLPLGVGENPNCALVTRDPQTLEVLSIQATQLNIGKIIASGVDVQLGYLFDMGGAGRLGVDVVGTYLEDLNFFTDANDPRTLDTEEGELGDPRVQINANLSYNLDSLSVSWRALYIGDAKFIAFAGMPSDQFDLPNTGTKVFHDLSIAYQLTPRANLRLNVINVFDEKPPARGGLVHSGIDGNAAIYPNLGTLLSGAFTYKF